jgi:TP901 family phage tail tape measure protein
MADGKVTIEIILEGKKLKGQIDKTALQTEKKFKETGKKAGKGFSSGFKSTVAAVAIGNFVAQQLSKAVAAISQAFKKSIQDLRDFSRGIAEINSILPANTRLTKEAQDAIAGFSREFASDAQAQAKSFYNIVSAGVRGTANQLKTLETANRAAVAGLVDINSAARVLIQSVNSYSKSGLTAEQASDSLFIAVREGVTTFGELSEFIGQTTAIAASSGVKFSELTGAIAFLTKQGITTDKAVIGLRQAIASIIKPTADAAAFAKRLNIEFDAQALKTKGLQGVLLEVTKATKGNSASIAKLFGNIRAFNVVNAIANGNLSDFNRILSETSNSAGATSRAFEIIAKNIDFQIKKTFSTITSVFLAVSRALAQTFGTNIQSALNNIQSLALNGIVPIAKFVNDYIVAPFELAFNFIRDGLQFINASINALLTGIITFASQLITNFVDIGNKLGIVSDETLKKFQDFTSASKVVLADFVEEASGSFDNLFEGTLFGKGEEFQQNLIDNLEIARVTLEETELPPPNFQGLEEGGNGFDKLGDKAVENAKRINAAFNGAIANAVAQGTQVITKALISGQNVFDAFGKAVLAIAGDMAIQLGKVFITTGIAMEALKSLGGAAAIAAGVGLIAIGTILKSFSGGAQGIGETPTGGGIATGGGFGGESTAVQEQEPVTQQAGTQVAVNISGDVLDSDETGLRIVNLIQNAFDENDVKVSGGAFA